MARLKRLLIDLALAVLRFYWRTVSPITVGVRAVVHDEDRRVLLVRHLYGDHRLHLPGGGVKRRESLFDALRRELAEETGLVVQADAKDVRLLGVYTNFSEGKSDHVAVFVVEAGQWSGELEPDGVEISRIRFEDESQLDAELSPGTVRRLEEAAGVRVVDYRW